MSVTGRNLCYKQTEILLHLDFISKSQKKDLTADANLTCVLLSLKENSETALPRMEADRKTDARLLSTLHTRLLNPNKKKKVADYKPQIPLSELLTDIELDSAITKVKKPVKLGNDLRIEKFQPYFKTRCCEEFKILMQNDRLHSSLAVAKGHPQSSSGGAFSGGYTNQVQQAAAFSSASNQHPGQQNNQYGGFSNNQYSQQPSAQQQGFGQGPQHGRPDQEPVSLFRAPVTQPPAAPPPQQNSNNQNNNQGAKDDKKKFVSPISEKKKEEPKKDDEKYPGLDNRLVEMIEREILVEGTNITWDKISGLETVKKHIQEIIVWPLMRPELFKGLRKPPRGLLLFGPPGTGKTMVCKAIANNLKYTFFSISASSLTSKWVGEGEKLVKTLFQLSLIKQPSVIFIDEIDSLLCSRSENENESSRRIKTEFLVQLDGAKSGEEDKILLIGATNRPEELDEAARRRFIKRLYIPLPDTKSRKNLITKAIESERAEGTRYEMTEGDIEDIVDRTRGYSAADMHNVLADACMAPLREVDIQQADLAQLRPITKQDYLESLKNVKSSVDPKEVYRYKEWNKKFGSFEFCEETFTDALAEDN